MSEIPWGKFLIHLYSGLQRQAHLPLAILAASQMRNTCVKRSVFEILLNTPTHMIGKKPGVPRVKLQCLTKIAFCK